MTDQPEPELVITEVATERVDGTIALAEVLQRLRENAAAAAPGGTTSAESLVAGAAVGAVPEADVQGQVAARMATVAQLADQLSAELTALAELQSPPSS
jgi:hypothetical protein